MPPFPVRRRPPAAAGTRSLVVGVIRATGAAAVHRAPSDAAVPGLGRWSPYRLPGGLTRRVVGRLDRLLVERAGPARAALAARPRRR